ncbi:AlbA family DNA-binding domain-containing protein [Bradyrhizobium diazoefficiens]
MDYKASPSLARDSGKPEELCKDVSALANSAGGQLVYGIEEDKAAGKPSKVDDGVVDPKITKEWIEQILNSKVQPRMDGVRIERIDMETGKFGYVITVQQSQIGPHQAPDGKYYKRFNFQSVPMHDYEIRDIMRRSTTPDLHVVLSFGSGNKFTVQYASHQELSQTFLLDCTVINNSATPATFAIVEVLIDYDIVNPFALDPFIQVGAIDQAPAPKLRIFRRTISAPPQLPIFKEAVADSHKAQIALQLPSSFLGSTYTHLQTKIMAQGVSRHEDWGIITKGATMELIPPESPLLIKTL